MPGLDGSLIGILMSQLAGKTIPPPVAPDVKTAAGAVPSWQPAPTGAGNAPMAYPMGPQTGGGMTDIMKTVASNPQSYGTAPQGMKMGGQLTDAALSAGATAALTPVLGPAAPVVGPMVGDMGTKAMGKGPKPQQQAPTPPPPKAPTPFQQPPLQLGSQPYAGPTGQPGGMSNDSYQHLLMMLQKGMIQA